MRMVAHLITIDVPTAMLGIGLFLFALLLYVLLVLPNRQLVVAVLFAGGCEFAYFAGLFLALLLYTEPGSFAFVVLKRRSAHYS
jgi:hypothetical protein